MLRRDETEMIHHTTNFHTEYMDVTQHWSPRSEKYAGGDALLTMLTRGWKMRRRVQVEEKWYAGMRSVTVYHLQLDREGETMKMPVVHNPYVNRLLSGDEVEMVPMKEQAAD